MLAGNVLHSWTVIISCIRKRGMLDVVSLYPCMRDNGFLYHDCSICFRIYKTSEMAVIREKSWASRVLTPMYVCVECDRKETRNEEI